MEHPETYRGIKLPPNFLKPDYMVTIDRECLDIDDLKPHQITTKGICRRLAKITRWRGETSHPLSVAYHTLVMYREAIKRGYSDAVRKAVLLHDAHEAYTLDLPRDIKHRPEMKPYRDLCDKVQERIDAKYNNSRAPEVEERVVELDSWAACEEYVELIFPGTKQQLFIQSSWWHDLLGITQAFDAENISDKIS